MTKATILDHNFGYVANRFLQHLNVTESPESLPAKQRMDTRKTQERQSAKRKKSRAVMDQTSSLVGFEAFPGNNEVGWLH